MPSSFDLSLQGAWPLLLLPLGLGLTLLGYRNTTPPLRTGQRIPLVVLRSLAYTLLLLVLASPVVNRIRNEPIRPRIALLVDESASMSTSDAAVPGAPTRIEQAAESVRALRDALGEWDVDLEVVPFTGQAGDVFEPPGYLHEPREATGAATDLLGALDTTIGRHAAGNLQSIVLFSDGRPTRGGIDPGQAAGLGRPVFTIGFGDTLAARDLGIGRLEYNPVAYMESEAEIEVRVENTGFRGHATRLRLLEGNREVFAQKLQFEQNAGRSTVRIPVQFEEAGRKRFRVVLDSADGEVTEKNNAREISIEVLKNRIRVLFIASRPDWDTAFLSRLLRNDPNVQLTLVHRNTAGAWIRSDESSVFGFPQAEGLLRDFDLFVIGSHGPGVRAGFWKDLVAAVERGKGLWVQAGREGALTNRIVSEALAPALPVVRERVRSPKYGLQGVRLTPQGRHHPATLALAELSDRNGELVGFAPLLAHHPEMEARPGALVLLSTLAEPATPILVTGRVGEGQSAVGAGFPMWRWGLTDRELVRDSVTHLVGDLVRWLTQPRDVEKVQVATTQNVYESGESAEFFAHVLDSQFVPLEDAEVRLQVRRLGEDAGVSGTLLLEGRAGRPGEYRSELPGLGPGEYEAEVVAEQNGVVLGRAKTRFTVDAYSVEFANTSQDVGFLRQLAEATGGRYATPAEAAALAQELPRAVRPVVLQSEIEIWNTAPYFILFVVVLAAEWLIRKRLGLL